MAYIFKGTILGALCRDCIEPLFGLKLRFYRLAPDRNVTALAVAAAKDTFTHLEDAAVAARQSLLLGEAEIDERGNFSFEFPAASRYDGGPFEVDLYCGTVPRLIPRPRPPQPLQFTITTLQPSWRTVENNSVAAWEYTVPYRYWCHIRGRFGAWTICGHVIHCQTKAPIGGVRVRAFDVDWLQDDALGQDVTDGAGHFRIDYSASDFKKTIFSPSINIEWTGGPDLYFRVETLSGTVLLAEPSSRGRASDRENAGPCFCVELCLEKQPPVVDDLPVFDALGGYLYASDIHSTVPGSGLTNGDNRAFYSTVRLNGVLPKRLNGQPMEYRFEFRETNSTGGSPGPWTAITPAQFANTHIGKLDRYAPTGPMDDTPVKTSKVFADSATPCRRLGPRRDRGGWTRVPQFSNVFGPEGNFVPNGNMIDVITGSLVASPAKNVTGVHAGQSSTTLGATLAQNRHISLRMRVREVGNPATEINAGTCAHVAIENTLYNGVAKGGSWAPSTVNGQLCVCSVDVLQLQAAGCAGISSGLDVLFTATHPNLETVSLVMTGPGGPYGFTLPPAVPGERFGTATNGFVIGSLADCAYIITLSVSLLLTTGDSVPSSIHDQIGFCKK
jgi:hypothetical protein